MDGFENPEILWRIGVFLGLLVLFSCLEHLLPRRPRVSSRLLRWRTNFSMTVLNSMALRIIEPVSAMLAAAYAIEQSWGVLNAVDLPGWAELVLALLVLDLAIYGQHVATHKIPILWRLHKVHHSDRDTDTTTALRFHIVEIVLSMMYKVALVFLLGPAVLAVLIFEIVLNGSALFNHANLALPQKLDQILRLIIVTPDMHRVHHSIRPTETDSNYGFSLSIWDRLFRTYRPQPVDGHDGMTIGLSEYQTQKPAQLFWSLALPFRGKSS